ncbi:rhomboid family intramembrane serine protease [Anoxynatronum buryatiense]|uniref:Membrane associated serine protease, rhomboid family n=1 Tax=Anoxynatronum buryatiense TaxID=489973 RepID=A0AA45WWX4_9CLOT|nr:rhomboid family intramembrane serine protease [Anoxynatronum buryatiense]SMP61470.1 Membrane associated serine protease, rhomboid family [Anoxynatronum buryatiense]
MIPLRDDVPSRSVPWMTWLLIAINLLAFRYQLSLSPEALSSLVMNYGFIPADFNRLLVPGTGFPAALQVVPLVTSLFLHGSWLHLISNLWSLWLFGDNVEDTVGHFRFFLFYLTGGVAASLVHFLFQPASTLPTIGASGAIAAVMGAYVIMFPLARITTLVPIFFIPLFFQVPALLFIGFWFISQVFSGVFTLFAPMNGGGIAWWAHIGGFLFGVLVIPFIRRKRWQYRCFYEDGHYHCQYD